MQPIVFIRQFVRHPGQTGALAPSSKGLAELITDAAGLGDASAVVEWGPGTGVFTEKIFQKKRPDALFFALEMNGDFVAATQARCPEAMVYHDSAVNTPRYLAQHGRTHCDCVLCGLPWASFPESLQDSLLDTLTAILRPTGRFLTFAYLQGLLLPAGQRFRKKLRSRFAHVTTTRTVWANLPPAFVYVASNEEAEIRSKK
jgi:phosphatidylethanolamine/phosphatidyl-N-methylethanolamine N-methyltransferase